MSRRSIATLIGSLFALPPVVFDHLSWGYGWVAIGGAIVGFCAYESHQRWNLLAPTILAIAWLALAYWFLLTWELPEMGLAAGEFPPHRNIVYAWPGLLLVAGLIAVIERVGRLEQHDRKDNRM